MIIDKDYPSPLHADCVRWKRTVAQAQDEWISASQAQDDPHRPCQETWDVWQALDGAYRQYFVHMCACLCADGAGITPEDAATHAHQEVLNYRACHQVWSPGRCTGLKDPNLQEMAPAWSAYRMDKKRWKAIIAEITALAAPSPLQSELDLVPSTPA